MNDFPALTEPSTAPSSTSQTLTADQWLVLASAMAQLIAPALVTQLSGRDFGDSPGDMPQIIPADYAFTIWGVIMLGCAAFSVYQALPAQSERSFYPAIRRPAVFVFSGFTFWLVAAVNQWLWVTVAIFIGMLGGLWRVLPPIIAERTRWTTMDRWLVAFPFGLYTAWTTVAIFANIASALTYYGWHVSGTSGLVWQVILLIGATLNASYGIRRTQGYLPYAGAILWSLAAIIVRNAAIVTTASPHSVAGFAPETILIGLTGIATAIVIGLTVFVRRESQTP